MFGRRRHQQREIAQQSIAEAMAWLRSLRDDRGTMEKEEPNWEGAGGRGEHRTVGPHRAYCHDCHQWCWSAPADMLCPCCDDVRVPERWRGENLGAVLADIRRQMEGLPHAYVAGRRAIFLVDVLNLIDDGGHDG